MKSAVRARSSGTLHDFASISAEFDENRASSKTSVQKSLVFEVPDFHLIPLGVSYKKQTPKCFLPERLEPVHVSFAVAGLEPTIFRRPPITAATF
mmetsp:Transcript_20342/g.50292  ORF Transcript_20342/g.50292 Transcript_20342/m.50292 type:complete len:95 (-) Transcript_20342:74-358(-)